MIIGLEDAEFLEMGGMYDAVIFSKKFLREVKKAALKGIAVL